MKRALLLASAVLISALGASASQAALMGNTINANYNFPDYGSAYGGFGMTPDATFVVGAGSEGTAYVDGNPIDVDFSDNKLVLTLPYISFTGSSFNGLVFTNLTGLFDSISSVNGASAFLDAGSTVLAINWSGMEYNQGDQVVVNFGAVPEPASWALMIGGFAIAGAAMRRRSAKIAFA